MPWCTQHSLSDQTDSLAELSACTGHIQVGRLPGWRFAFLSVAALSFLIGAVTFWLGQEPRKQRGTSGGGAGSREGNIRLEDIAGHMFSVMRVPTFGLLVAQVPSDSPGTTLGLRYTYFTLTEHIVQVRTICTWKQKHVSQDGFRSAVG